MESAEHTWSVSAGLKTKGSADSKDMESAGSVAGDSSSPAGADFNSHIANSSVDQTAASPDDRKMKKKLTIIAFEKALSVSLCDYSNGAAQNNCP